MTTTDTTWLDRDTSLTHCSSEPIHVPGQIQPHGVLLTLREPELTVLQASRNVDRFFGMPAEELLGQPVGQLLEERDLTSLREHLRHANLSELNPVPLSSRAERGGHVFDGILHRHDGVLLLELEPAAGRDGVAFPGFYQRVRRGAAAFQHAGNLDDLFEAAVREVRRITGFDRVMIYRFDAEWNGEVVAEECVAGMESFLGLHYPASDIPEQARRLYTINWLRLIADVGYAPCSLVPELNPLTGRPLDMSFSVLRSVSPVHVEYLKNMEVGASMSISLIRDNRLWGLIACHHRTALQVPYVVRMAAEFLGQVLSLQLSRREEQRDYDYTLQLDAVRASLLEGLRDTEDVVRDLAARAGELLAVTGAAGAVISQDGQLLRVGETPSAGQIRELERWLDREHPEELFATDSLPTLLPEARQFKDVGSGLLAITLARGSRLLWFRPEAMRVVNWSGDPNKASEAVDGRIHPRRSFAIWKQTVRLKSFPWTAAQRRSALDLRGDLLDLLLRRVESRAQRELETLNAQLAASNRELDSFAFIASHDLKEPLRGIQQTAQFMLEDHAERLDADGLGKLQTLTRLSARMQDLIDSLLQVSRVGRVELATADTDLNTAVQDVLELLRLRLADERVEVRIPRPLPAARCDRVRVTELFNNLISNALKYNDKGKKWIEIGYVDPDSECGNPLAPVVFYVRDNGIGIRQRHLNVVFDLFRRLHTRDKFGGGTGAGLTIVRKIVERHGGHIWAESEPEVGTTFYFTLAPKG